MKQCSKCSKIKEPSEFNVRNTSSDRLTSWCKECIHKDSKRRYHADPERSREHNRAWYKRNRFHAALKNCRKASQVRGYPPCTATVKQLADSFTGLCEICGRKEDNDGKRLSMDHCHITGAFRGWLCTKCNLMIGHAGESTRRLMLAVRYLSRAEKKKAKDGPLPGQREFGF